MTPSIEELKQLIIHNLDATDFLDLLSLDITDLVDILEEQIQENFASLVKAVT